MSVFGSHICTERYRGTDCTIDYLPAELLVEIFRYFDIEDLVSCVKTCSRWRQGIYSDERIWRGLCLTLTESLPNIAQDRLQGYSWKVIVRIQIDFK